MTESAEVLRVSQALRRALREAGLSLREAETRLGMGRDYLSQLLRGTVDLKLKHVFALLEVARKDPAAFWAEVYGPSQTIEEMRRVAREEIERHLKSDPKP